VPTAQTKANQETDFYLKSTGGEIGPITVNGNIELGAPGDYIDFPITAAIASQGSIRFSESITGNRRWFIGKTGIEAGGNSGSDLTFFRYADNGTFIASPVTISRSSGNVTMTAGAAIATQLNVGLQSGAGIINVVGPAGASQVFDPVYNPPTVGNDSLLLSLDTNGNQVSNVTFTPTASGTYIFSATVKFVADPGFAWVANNSIACGLTYNAGANNVSGGLIYITGIQDPTGLPAIGGIPADTGEYQVDCLVELTAGTPYICAFGKTGPAINLGPGGGVAYIIAKLIT
jgi:hypothetical protein